MNGRALYSEIDPKAAAWLRELIRRGLIAPGDVDERDIRDLTPEYVSRYTQFHAFAGIGVWSHALRLAGWPDDRPVWTGSPPCQPFSAAGKGLGTADERHLWPAFFHLIDVCRPDTFVGEQVARDPGARWWILRGSDGWVRAVPVTGYSKSTPDFIRRKVAAAGIRITEAYVIRFTKLPIDA